MLLRCTAVVLLCFNFIITCNLQEYTPEWDVSQNQTAELSINETESGVDKEDVAVKENKIKTYPCTDYRDISNSVLTDTPSVLNVTSKQLAEILQDSTIVNRCAIVYFFASWSHYSCEYALQYNAIGRAFNSLPILAIDLLYNDVSNPEYVVLYYPSISLFVNGTIAKRFDPSKNFEELKTLISSVTGLEPLPNITLSDADKEGPLSTVPTPVENNLFKFCVCYLLSAGVVSFLYYLSPVTYIRTWWSRPKTD